MGDSTIGLAGGSRHSQRGWLTGGFAGFAVGVGLCAAFGVLQAARGWNKHDPDGARTGAQDALASKPVPVADVPVAFAQASHPASAKTKPETRPVDPARVENSPLAHGRAGVPEKASPAPIARSAPAPIARSARPVLTAATGRMVAGGSDRFTLSPAPVSMPAPVVLPEKPWFALAHLTTDDPESCQGTQAVCAVNRSLNTALTWAKSAAEAAEKAEREGKLVFLIHVSGNFENPGFT